ncbi:hypothetical protein [Flavobacterium sp.]|uniref:hypothetical protein n=1 Tax=Flavobacterium sp. TaxID=239 RepID=UPI002ED83397
MKLTYQGKNFDVMTYRSIRRAIGYLAISLPIILLTFSYFKFFNTKPQPSISDYYYTNLREIFTGTLCAVGLFLIRYEGHRNASIWKNDKLLTNIAGIMAIGVALVPTTAPKPDLSTNGEKPCEIIIYTLIHYPLNWLHYTFAAVLFLILALIALNVFTIKNENDIPAYEYSIYRFCGYSILLFIILIPLNLFNNATLVFEALSLFSFGTAWLIKGRALGDKGNWGRKLYGEENNQNTEKIFEE